MVQEPLKVPPGPGDRTGPEEAERAALGARGGEGLFFS